jgi:hypothetical protein
MKNQAVCFVCGLPADGNSPLYGTGERQHHWSDYECFTALKAEVMRLREEQSKSRITVQSNVPITFVGPKNK